MITILLVTAILAYLAMVAAQRLKYLRLREELGLRGPPASFFLGNIGEMVERTKRLGYDDAYDLMAKWFKTYGQTYGIYMGRHLQIVTMDKEFIKEVFIKQFSNFTDRCIPDIFFENGLNQSLVQMKRESGWKEVRSCMSTQFTNGKMKMMHETVKDKIALFLSIIEEKSKSPTKFNIYDDLQALTMDVIGKCAFAIESNCQKDRNEIFYVQAQEMFRQIDMKENLIVPLSLLFPELSWLLRWFYPHTGMCAAEKPLLEGLSRVYDMRKEGVASESIDILQLLLNKENKEGDSLSKQEAIQNCFAFLLAGYETTSTALGYAVYYLARHREMQERLYYEIIETKNREGLSFETIHQMKYLDAVFKETLRIAPPVIFFTARECVEDTVVCGQFIPKGTWVSMMPYAIQRSEDNWEDPDEFKPERFLDWTDKNSLSWVPFGVGPRNCVGMRFAEMEFKMVLARLIEQFVVQLPKDEEEMICHALGVIMIPKGKAINTIVTKRPTVRTVA